MVEITPNVVKRYQSARLKEKAGPKTINDEVQLLLRLCGEQGALIRATLRRDKALKLTPPPSPGRPYSIGDPSRLVHAAVRGASAGVVCVRLRNTGAEGPYTPNHVIQDGVDQGPREGWGKGPMA